MSLGDRLKKMFGRQASPSKPRSFDEQVGTFWAWWNANARAFAADVDRGNAARWSDEVSERLAAVDPNLAWETGPGRQSRHHLAISAEGDAELRVVAERVLSQGPTPSADWEYYAARQRAAEDPAVQIEFDDGVVIDFALMRLGVEEDEPWERLDLTFFHPGFENLDDDRCVNIAFLVLDNLLGEDEVERWVGSIDTTRTNPPAAITATELRAQVDALAARSSDNNLSVIEYNHVTGTRLLATWSTKLKRLDNLFYDHHVEIVLTLSTPNDEGLCDEAELEHLAEMEDELIDALSHHAIWFGHVIGHGRRSTRMQILPLSPATELIDSWVLRHPEYDIDYTVTKDPAWTRFRDVLGALAETVDTD